MKTSIEFTKRMDERKPICGIDGMHSHNQLRIPPAWYLLSLVSICVAFVLVRMDAPINNDGIAYIGLAGALHDGQFKHTVFPPGFMAAIALVSGLGIKCELAARLVMFISVALLPILFALAFRPFIGSRASVLAGFCWLVFPLHVNIAKGVWSEPLFYDIVLLFVMLPIGANPSAVVIPIVRGVLAAVAYLVRPEGLIVFAVDSLSRVCCVRWRRGAQVLWPTSLAVVTFACCIAPYVLFLHSQTGKWMLSGKSGLNYQVAEQMSSGNIWVRNIWKQPQKAPDSETNKAVISRDVRRYVNNGKKVHEAFLSLFSLPGILLMGCGIVFFARRGREVGSGIIAAMAAPCFVLPFFYFSEVRYLFGGCLAGVALVSAGLIQLFERPAEYRAVSILVLPKVIAVILALSMLQLWGNDLRAGFSRQEGSGASRRVLGKALRQKCAGQSMLSISMVTPYYAGAKLAGTPTQMTADEVIRLAQSNGISYIEVSTYDSQAFHPSLLSLLDEGARSNSFFHPVASVTSGSGDVFTCFQIERGASGSAACGNAMPLDGLVVPTGRASRRAAALRCDEQQGRRLRRAGDNPEALRQERQADERWPYSDPTSFTNSH